MILPGFGAISHVFAAFSRKRVFGYTGMVWAIGVIAFVGFLVWAHHMFTVGMPVWLNAFFMYGSLVIAVPTGIKVFSWLATMWGGVIRFTAAMKFACGFIAMFVIGGFGGLLLALTPIDQSLHDSYFVVGHFHMAMVGGSVMLLFAMTYYWWPKMTGRMLSERQGTWIFWLMLVGIVLAFLTMHLTGALGMARRVPVFFKDFLIYNHISTLGYALTFVSSVWFFIDLLMSYRRPKVEGDDPWGVNDVQRSFEWATACPPPVYNFAEVPPIPVVEQAGHDDQAKKPH
jgi:cytochrome c oxidase subunit 1